MGCHSSSADSEQLLQTYASSVCRPHLRRLTRKQLRVRLAELGAARSEAEGLFHGELVDVVLLWNCLWKLHLDERDAQEEAVRALRHSGLPAHLLRKALLVVGVAWKDCCNLNGKEAEAFLNQRLVQLVMRKAASGLISGTTYSLLLACFQGWKLLKGGSHIVGNGAVLNVQNDGFDCGAVFEGLREESRRREEIIGLMEHGKRDEAVRQALEDRQKPLTPRKVADEEDPAYWQQDEGMEELQLAQTDVSGHAPVVSSDLDRVCDSPPGPPTVPVAQEGLPAVGMLKTDLTSGIQKKHRSKVPSGVAAECGSADTDKVLADTSKSADDQAARDRKFEALDTELAEQCARDEKFAALDSEMAQWLDDFAEASPLPARI